MRGWVSIPLGFVGISLEYTLALAHRCTESQAKVSQTSPFLRLEITQVRVYSLFFRPLSCVCCVLCVRKEIWNAPGRSWEKPPDDRMAMSSLGGWGSWDRLAVYCHRATNDYHLILHSNRNSNYRTSRNKGIINWKYLTKCVSFMWLGYVV